MDDLDVDVKVEDTDGLTALDYASEVTHRPLRWIKTCKEVAWSHVTMLLQAGATFGPKSTYTNKTLLHMARNNADAQEAVCILESKVDTRAWKKPKRYLSYE